MRRHLDILRIPARLSQLGVTEIYYDYVEDDWHERADRLQARRRHHVRHAERTFHDKKSPGRR